MKKLKIDPAECMNNYSKFVKNCIQPHPTQLTDRLCGLEDKCDMGEPTSSHNFQKVMAIELTKNRIMQNFAFVGIADHMILSLQVLENVAPRFFKNVRVGLTEDSKGLGRDLRSRRSRDRKMKWPFAGNFAKIYRFVTVKTCF